jgi:hypothetical protein
VLMIGDGGGWPVAQQELQEPTMDETPNLAVALSNTVHRLLGDASLIVKAYIRGQVGTVERTTPWETCVVESVVRALKDPTVAESVDGQVLLRMMKDFLQVRSTGYRVKNEGLRLKLQLKQRARRSSTTRRRQRRAPSFHTLSACTDCSARLARVRVGATCSRTRWTRWRPSWTLPRHHYR